MYTIPDYCIFIQPAFIADFSSTGGYTDAFLNINQLTSEQILDIFELTDRLRLRQSEPLLEGKTMILFFPETSLRTRVSFEKGIRDLGGACITFPPETLEKKEAPGDIVRYLENWGMASSPEHLTSANWRSCPPAPLFPLLMR